MTAAQTRVRRHTAAAALAATLSAALAVILACAACVAAQPAQVAGAAAVQVRLAPNMHLAPLHVAEQVHARATLDERVWRDVADSFIVVVDPSTHDSHVAAVPALATGILERFLNVRPFNLDTLRGYSVAFPGLRHAVGIAEATTLINGFVTKIRASPDVMFVEENQVVSLYDDVEPNTEGKPAGATQEQAPWGLGRVSSRTAVNETIDLTATFHYFPQDGAGVTAYVVDTGINIDHEDFEGRAKWGATIPDNDEDIDGNGHGTHVAGTIVGSKYGVAKAATVVAVKVLRSSGSGSMADVISGVEFVYKKHKRDVELAAKKGRKARSVANMSLGGGRSPALNYAIDAAVNAGVHFVVAAGNENQDACNVSPASAEKAFTVGATTIEDARAWFSNFGPCLDIFAPGHQILSTWIGSKNATNSISGTSMASPHVAGVFTALLSRKAFSNMTVDELRSVVVKVSGKNKVTDIPERPRSVNRMVYSLPPEVYEQGFSF